MKKLYPVEGLKNVMASNSGIKRPPKKGEYFLSGAIVVAYKAYQDLTSEYYIADLHEVKTQTKTVHTIIRDL